ncbi:MAG TPA: preprotein translocase subunit SecE [Cyanobacteria bacterium UBA8156]|jgi:preprotein translocase subunit SecE|nr:preprotein translocase subunit SecE [Cyanobacteria bacterium UBA8156]
MASDNPNNAKDSTAKAEGGDPPLSTSVLSADFLKESQQELAKVVWPTRQQLFSESVAILLMVVVAATLVYLLDALFGWLAARLFAV